MTRRSGDRLPLWNDEKQEQGSESETQTFLSPESNVPRPLIILSKLLLGKTPLDGQCLIQRLD